MAAKYPENVVLIGGMTTASPDPDPNHRPYRPRPTNLPRKQSEFGPARMVPHTHLSGKYRWLVRLPDGTSQYEHILVWEKVHGRKLPKGYVVHHLNGDPLDNRPENLMMMEHGAHVSLHKRGKYPSSFLGPDGNLHRRCRMCGQVKPLTRFPSNGYSKIGTPTFRPQCCRCNSERQKSRNLR